MQSILRGRGLGRNRNAAHHNYNYGRDQNLINGGDQHIYNGQMNTAGRDFIHNFYTVIGSRELGLRSGA